MQILDDLYAETRRLLIAGSKFAKNDPRILKYIPTLEKMGEKAPIMKKLAEKYTVLENEGQPDALANAGTFLYAVLATQGSTEISGEESKYASSLFKLPKTSTPYSRLKPIMDALTLSMQGRYEVITTAFEDGLLNDFRLYGPIAAALDDKYTAIADYLYEQVIPRIGSVFIPYLLELYDPKGKQGDAMRIGLLSELGYERAEALALQAIEEGSVSVAAAGIKILGNNPANETYLLTLANDKKAELREAALVGLIKMDSSSGKESMMKMLKSSKYKSAIQAATLCTDIDYAGQLLALLKPKYECLYSDGLKEDEFIKANNQFVELLPSLDNMDEPAIYVFYQQLLNDERYNKRLKEYKTRSYSINDIQAAVCRQLRRLPKDKMLLVCEETLSVQVARKSPDIVGYYYNTLLERKTHTDEEMFSIFSKYYEAGIIRFVDLFCPIGFYPNGFSDKESMEAEFKRIQAQVHTSWKKLFIQRADIDAILVLLSKEDAHEKEMREVLIKKLKNSDDKRRTDYTLGLAVGRLVEIADDKKLLLRKSELEKVAEACYEVFEKCDGYHLQYFYEGLGTNNVIKLFDSDYTEKFQGLSNKKTASVFKTIAEALLSNQEK